VEFIIADHDEVFWKQSFEIGAQRLLEKFQKHDPILPAEINQLEDYFDQSLQPLWAVLQKYNPVVLVGSSGTFDTLSDIFCITHDIQKSPEEIETPLTPEGFYDIYREIVLKNRQDRLEIPGMIEMRVDMIVVACCLIKFLLEKHPFNRIRVSTYSLKEGVLAYLSESRGTTLSGATTGS
jgi:exopolyphosphatase/guanosine-5'-triphosphate,3'-diphosphate pyrophosphatase